ncbi:MAG: hypothetical protein AABZ39_07505 [Spirochaetota bacterium]
MPLSTTEKIGFCEAVIDFMQKNQTDLDAKGLKVDGWIKELAAQKSDAVTQNNEQEAMKAKQREKTTLSTSALVALYENVSSKLDAVIGTLGKKSELAVQAKRLRSKIRGVKHELKKAKEGNAA